MACRHALILFAILLALPGVSAAQTNIAGRLDAAIKAAGVPIIGVSIVDPANRATWTVKPAELQSAAQPTIDAFDPDNPALLAAELDAQVTSLMDNERVFAALVWAILDTYSAPATPAKFQAARAKIIAAYRNRPWLP